MREGANRDDRDLEIVGANLTQGELGSRCG
jgi:hypothetical protein